MSGKRSRNKGATGERECVHFWKDVWPDVRRNLSQTREGGYDLLGTPYTIEVKRGKRPNVWAAYEQASKAMGEEALPPLVLARKDHGEWMAFMEAKELKLLIERIAQLEQRLQEKEEPYGKSW